MNQSNTKVYTKPTIKHVAELARVSQGTVSHFINGRTNICSETTGQRIRKAISDLNFVPARSIYHQQTRSTQTIGVCVSPPPPHGDAFNYTQLHDFWSGMTAEADKLGYKLLHFPSAIRDAENCDAFLDGSIDGLLISAITSNKRFQTLAQAGMPAVAIARWNELPPSVGAVWSDDAVTIDLAMNHLWALGHRQIAHLAACEISPLRSDVAAVRLARYWSWLSEHDEAPWELVISCPSWDPLSFEDAKECLRRMLDGSNPATAVVCANDAIAFSILHAASVLGVKVPQDLSVVGIDNDLHCIMTDPPLTSVELPFLEIGRESVKVLNSLMTGSPVSDRHLAIPVTKLVVRDSTGPVDR